MDKERMRSSLSPQGCRRWRCGRCRHYLTMTLSVLMPRLVVTRTV